MSADAQPPVSLGRRLATEILAPLKSAFVGKDEIIDLLGVCLAAGENLFLLGPPGTAKSAVVQELGRRLDGRVFDYLLTRFTEPNEIFGPFDIRKLRDGELVTNTEGMLPEAAFAFLDELLNANSAILNSLLLALNERIFRRGRETRKLPLLMVVAASNRLPEDEALAALFDRFLLRVRSDNVPGERLPEVLEAGWRFDQGDIERHVRLSVDDVRELQREVWRIDIRTVRPRYVALVQRLRAAGIPVSDRRSVKLQKLLAASALLCGRAAANTSDLWVLRYIWDTEDQIEVLTGIVGEAVRQSDEQELAASHPRAAGDATPDPEDLARQLEQIATLLGTPDLPAEERALQADRLAILSSRSQWVVNSVAREHLEGRLAAIWQMVRTPGS